MVTVVGDAGVGKTRLIEEFLSATEGEARLLRGRCLPYGDGITFWPAVEMLEDAAGIREDDDPTAAIGRIAAVAPDPAVTERLASMIGLADTPFPVPELFWALERFLDGTAAEHPVIALIDDVHWAEPTFLDLLAHLLGALHSSPILLLCTARGQLLEDHPEWGTGAGEHRVVLAPLGPGLVAEMIQNFLGGAGIDAEVIDRVVEAGGGNPLFVEQFLTMLVEDGVLVRDGERWASSGHAAEISVPPSIEALLTARLDRLGWGEKQVVEPASVIGREFAGAAVAHLVTAEFRSDVGGHLGSLAAKQLIRPHEEDGLYRFEHQLIRDAAYAGLLKQARAVFHERFVEWADRLNRERHRETEFEEILGFHLEQAYRYWSELGPLDAHGIELGIRASERLAAAGGRALSRGDMPAAARLLARAAATLPNDHRARPRLLLQAGESRFEAGDFDAADAEIATAAEAAEAVGDSEVAVAATIERLRMGYETGRVTDAADLEERVRALLPPLEAVHGHAGLARAWRLLASVELAGCRWGRAEEAAWRMIEQARQSGDRTMEMRVLPILTLFLQKGPTPVAEALNRCRQILDQVSSNRRAEAMVMRQLGQLHAMRMEIGEARALYRASRHTLEDLGWVFDSALVSLDSGPIEMLAGDPAVAEAELRRDYEALDTLGDRNFIALTSALLGEALYRQGRYDEAETHARFAEQTAVSDDLGPQVLWRSLQAKLRARGGTDSQAALEMATEALRLIKRSDDPSGQAETLVDLAEVARLTGDTERAETALRDARGRYLAKGNLAGVHRVDRLRAATPVEVPGPATP
jgi:tetratricopeptide (TPR) repeat protein